MSNPNADVLNDVTKTLIDSQKGYQKVCDLSDESYALRGKFQSLAAEREELIHAFQARIRDYGEEPVSSGGAGGALHRAWTDFTSLFESDEKAALDAVDDGEDYLANKIEAKLKEEGLDAATRDLLQRARASARYGEKFADELTDH
ncbi:PA2169 family four-helix-bundle protein [Henriciella aquimarina]|uniref:PA2169 family four-helix-bundle protein n=1 Tax=Henriciella aquimarina TaxID=545261 RepID=UPI000A052011|nr:PA2169 family four-helix-bundle protein [Henriciella aquimarina]